MSKQHTHNWSMAKYWELTAEYDITENPGVAFKALWFCDCGSWKQSSYKYDDIEETYE